MIGEYTCEYLLITGKPCGRPCMRPEGCRIHWKTKSRFPCAVCGKPTGSSSGRCQSHIGSYYQNRLRCPRFFRIAGKALQCV
ncbi:unnamed protein product [Rhizophagus irregularis]|nr:unnamed protein product [Rhizophagus irregularis]